MKQEAGFLAAAEPAEESSQEAGFPAAAAQRTNRFVVVEGLGRLPQFSHATVSGEWVYVSGTLGTLPGSMDLAPGGTGPETTQTLRNIGLILEASGAGFADVVKVSVYLKDMGTFATMNDAYGAFFPGEPPARITVGVADLALGAAAEIECVARVVAS